MCGSRGSSRLGSRPRASRVGRALWTTARTRTLAERGARAQAVRQSSGKRWLAEAIGVRCSCHARLDENAARHLHPAYQMARNNLSQESQGDDGVQSQPCLRLSLLTPPMTLTRAMGRRGPHFGSDTQSILAKPVSDLTPQLITHVETTAAPLSDEGALSAIHTDLAEKELLPEQHLVDAGYVTIAHLVQSQSSYEVDLVGPTLKTHWYQAETGYDLTHFDIDWEAQTVTCPEGRPSSSWTPVQDAGKSLIKVKFSQSDCKVCPARASCTGTTRRTLTLHPKEQMQALFAARKREGTDEFKETYRHRAGIEGTHSQGVRTMGLRRSRYIGLRKTHLGHVAIATAVNIIQLMSWLRGEAPEQTRTSAFKRVMEQAA